jgi:hypothetical protein
VSSVQPARGAVLPMWGEMTQPLDQALHSLDDAGPRLSKSRLLAYRPCERRLWLGRFIGATCWRFRCRSAVADGQLAVRLQPPP